MRGRSPAGRSRRRRPAPCGPREPGQEPRRRRRDIVFRQQHGLDDPEVALDARRGGAHLVVLWSAVRPSSDRRSCGPRPRPRGSPLRRGRSSRGSPHEGSRCVDRPAESRPSRRPPCRALLLLPCPRRLPALARAIPVPAARRPVTRRRRHLGRTACGSPPCRGPQPSVFPPLSFRSQPSFRRDLSTHTNPAPSMDGTERNVGESRSPNRDVFAIFVAGKGRSAA